MFLLSLDSGLPSAAFSALFVRCLGDDSLRVRLSVHLCRPGGCRLWQSAHRCLLWCQIGVCVCATVKGSTVLSNVCICVLRVSRSCTPLVLYVCVCVCLRGLHAVTAVSQSVYSAAPQMWTEPRRWRGWWAGKKKKNEGEEEGELKVGACVWVRERLCVCYSCESSWGAEYTRKDTIGRGSENSDGIMIGVLI